MDKQRNNQKFQPDSSVNDAKWMLLSVVMTGFVVFGTGLFASVISA